MNTRRASKLSRWTATTAQLSLAAADMFATPVAVHWSSRLYASWSLLYQNRTAIKVTGSPFKTFVEAENACNAIFSHLNDTKNS